MMFNVVSYEKVSPTVNRIIKKLIKKMVLPLLTILLITTGFPVWATSPHCSVTGGVIQLNNVNLPAGVLSPGTVLHTSPPFTVNYQCVVTAFSSIFDWYPSLDYSAASSNFSQVKEVLNNLGLGMNIKIKDEGQSPSVEIPWSALKTGGITKFGGFMGVNGKCKSPGQPDIPEIFDCTYARKAEITVQLIVENNFPSSSTIQTVPSLQDALRIVPDPSGRAPEKGKGIDTKPFNISFLSRDLFKLEITPQTVNLGRLYKTDTNLFRSGDFTVTVKQNKNIAPNQRFTLPLEITFQGASLSLMNGGKGLVLKNTDGDNNMPNDNGLQLAIRDKTSNKLVTFNQKTSMGDLDVTWDRNGGVPSNFFTRQYAVEVSRISGAEIKTGQFTASVPVIVTYN
nr:hypothetical protein [Salmonella enterica]